MPKINLLDSFIYNRISAGEVVERPASVVKELVENSIDAGADSISIEIRGGGLKSIIITDNGCGIDEVDVKSAFLPHATSKISNVDDLDTISTLGFRGEALASISAVSHTTLITRTIDSDVGCKLEVSAGTFGEIEYCSANVGTMIEVSDLFYNTPARLKFIKSVRSEESEITHVVSKIIFANSNVAFRYIIDGKLIYNTTGNDIQSAIYEIWGKDIFKGLMPISNIDDQRGNIRLNGYISHPTLTKSNRNYQVVMVNGRVVVDQNISYVVQNAYQDLIMKKNFPIFILDIIVPFDTVDVNVHPAKTEIRFANPQAIYGAIYNTVKTKLSMQEQLFAEGVKSTMPTIEFGKTIETPSKTVDIKPNYNEVLSKTPHLENTTPNSVLDNIVNYPTSNQTDTVSDAKNFASSVINGVYELGVKKMDSNPFVDTKVEELIDTHPSTQETIINQSQMSFAHQLNDELGVNKKIIGQLFKTYLLVESNDRFYLIDQHAAHERLLYDKLIEEFEKFNEISTQPMLLPYIKSLSSIDYDFICDKMPQLNQIGISIEEFGPNTIKINAVPSILIDINLDKLIDDVLREGNEYKKLNSTDLKRDKLARTACRAAVKGGTELSEQYIDKLLIALLESNIPLKCPHGRPIIVSYTKNEIEKWFKRII